LQQGAHHHPDAVASAALTCLETATLYVLPALVIISILLAGVAPRFRVFREQQIDLLWREAIVTGLPFFIVLGLFQETILSLSLPGFVDHVLWKAHLQSLTHQNICANMLFRLHPARSLRRIINKVMTSDPPVNQAIRLTTFSPHSNWKGARGEVNPLPVHVFAWVSLGCAA
jgi:hypothetical protein